MSNNHPEDNYPLRAWLVTQQKLVTVIQLRWSPKRNLRFIDVYELNGLLRDGNYQVGVDAILLHPTGVKGVKVCEVCGGDGCPNCKGSGHVSTMIYDQDIVLEYPGLDCNGRIGIVAWDERTARWAIRKWMHWTYLKQVDTLPLRLESDVNGKPRLTIVGTLYEFSSLIKPHNTPDVEWEWVKGEQRWVL